MGVEKLPLTLDEIVVWGETDADGQVQTAVLLRWCESARRELFEGSGIRLRPSAIEAWFEHPVVYPDTVSVILSIQGVSARHLDLAYTLWSENQHKSVARVKERLVCQNEDHEPADWPAEVLYRLQELHFEQNWSED